MAYSEWTKNSDSGRQLDFETVWPQVTKFARNSRLRWVNQLIVSIKNEWNINLVLRLFSDFDVEEIFHINHPST